MQSPPRNFDSFPKRFSVRNTQKPTKFSLFSILLSLILFLVYSFADKHNWDLDYLYLTSQWQVWRLFTSLFIMKSGIELICTIVLIVGYLGCGAEVKKGSIRTIWELVLLGTSLNIGKFLF
jgi:hypothetical protein